MPWYVFHPRRVGYLNPVFRASRLVVGADADLIVDDMLVEIKTTVDSRIRREQYNQLLGYYLLYLLAGIDDVSQTLPIRRLAVYQSARGVWWNGIFTRSLLLKYSEMRPVTSRTRLAMPSGGRQTRTGARSNPRLR